MSSHSRQRPKSKGPITVPLIERRENPVSHEMEVTVLDAAELAFRHAVRELERPAMKLSHAERRRFREKCVLHLLGFLVNDPCWTTDELSRLRELYLAQAELLAACEREAQA